MQSTANETSDIQFSDPSNDQATSSSQYYNPSDNGAADATSSIQYHDPSTLQATATAPAPCSRYGNPQEQQSTAQKSDSCCNHCTGVIFHHSVNNYNNSQPHSTCFCTLMEDRTVCCATGYEGLLSFTPSSAIHLPIPERVTETCGTNQIEKCQEIRYNAIIVRQFSLK